MPPKGQKATSTRRPTKPPSNPARARTSRTAGNIPVLEWIAASVGFGLTLLIVGAIAWEAFADDDTPPSMQVTLERVSPVSGGYVAEIALTNQGGEPAAQVAVEGVLPLPDGAREVAEVVFDYVPDHSTRKGGLFFRADPRHQELELRAKGYVEP